MKIGLGLWLVSHGLIAGAGAPGRALAEVAAGAVVIFAWGIGGGA